MKNPSKRITWKEISRQKFLMVCAAIFFVYGIVFYYVPLAGWVMAFQDYKPKDGLFGSKFVGLQKFKFLFSDDVFLRDIRNTLAMGVLNLVTTFLMAIIFAILLNEVRNMFGKKLVQTISYLPHFLSWIIVTGILHDALSSTGIVNELLLAGEELLPAGAVGAALGSPLILLGITGGLFLIRLAQLPGLVLVLLRDLLCLAASCRRQGFYLPLCIRLDALGDPFQSLHGLLRFTECW